MGLTDVRSLLKSEIMMVWSQNPFLTHILRERDVLLTAISQYLFTTFRKVWKFRIATAHGCQPTAQSEEELDIRMKVFMHVIDFWFSAGW